MFFGKSSGTSPSLNLTISSPAPVTSLIASVSRATKFNLTSGQTLSNTTPIISAALSRLWQLTGRWFGRRPGIVGRVTRDNFCGAEQYVALAYCAVRGWAVTRRARSVMRHGDIVIDAGPISISRGRGWKCRRRGSTVCTFAPDRSHYRGKSTDNVTETRERVRNSWPPRRHTLRGCHSWRRSAISTLSVMK